MKKIFVYIDSLNGCTLHRLIILKRHKDVYKDINELTTVEITKF